MDLMGKRRKRVVTVFWLILFVAVMRDIKAIPEPKPKPEVPLKPDVVEYKADNLRDPFSKKEQQEYAKKQVKEETVQKEPLPPLEIQGVVWGGVFPQTIINNKVLKIGDVIEGVRIVDIGKDGVTIFFNAEQHKLSSPAAGSIQGDKKNP